MKTLEIDGHAVPVLGQGTWNVGDSAAKRKAEIATLRRGIDCGMTLIDSAEMYGNGLAESLVGEAIAGVRDRVYVVSKVLPSNASLEGTERACEASLKRLGVETIDLYLLHWRGRYPLADTVKAFERLLEQGMIRAWGVSNFDVDDMEELFDAPGGDACAANQVLYNPEHRGIEYDLLPWCEKHEVTVMAYSPVGQGGGRLLNSAALGGVADRHKLSPAQAALAWCLRQPVLAIPKASSVKHVEENAAASEIDLDEQDLAEIDKAYPAPKRKQALDML
ncbi:MAG TPA: aldo/keto reductase [Terracidiphilus sp.]|jgi:diketogulonate reductase-like aldo/keto reductase|nr:aldo/keto reductase [Terracidiphilus sp.]